MKLEEIKTILEDTGLTLNQKAANLEAAILKASTPSALNITPMKPRAKRGPNKAKDVKPLLSEGFVNGADHEAH